MADSPLDGFDPSPYLYVPLLTVQTLITLSKALEDLLPGSAPEFVQAEAKQLQTTRQTAEADLIDRLRDDNENVTADTMLDGAVDGLWVMLRDRLVGLSAYAHPGLAFIDKNPPPGVDMVAARDKANRAKAIATRLFGSTNNLEMLQRKFAEQSQMTATVLGLIDADGLAQELVELSEPDLLPILRHCQVAYESMVKRRAASDKGTRPDLRTTRTRLRRSILRYNQAALLMLDEESPESVTIVQNALQPMINLRPPRSSNGGDEVEVEETPAPPIEPLDAQP